MIRLLPPRIARAIVRRHRSRETETHELLYLFLEITRRCNLNCLHCGSDCTAMDSSGHLTTDSWIRIIDFIAQSFTPAPVLVLTGGEPILHRQFDRLLECISRNRLRFGIVSNGYALDDNTLKALTDAGIQSITLSLDGLEDSHNWLRCRSDSFRNTIHALERIVTSSIPRKDVVTCVNPRNIGVLDRVADLLIGLGIPAWRLFRIFPAGRAQGNQKLLLNHAQTLEMIHWIRANRKPLVRRGLKVNLSCEGWLPIGLDLQVRDTPFFCRAGVNIASILCDGTITGCTNNAPLFRQGNVLEDNFANVWNERFHQFRSREWVHQSRCSTCIHLQDCRGGSIHLWRSSLQEPDFCYADCLRPDQESKCQREGLQHQGARSGGKIGVIVPPPN